MKKQISSIVLVLSMLFMVSTSQASTGDNNKKITPQERVVKNFTEEFSLTPSVTKSNNGFIATSVVDQHAVSSAYNKRGNKIYTITRYTYDNLDKNIIDVVKMDGNYNKYFITSMEKIEKIGSTPVYLVHLTDSKSIKTLSVDGDNIVLTQNLKKI